MKFKKAKVLCMITAVSILMAAASVQKDSDENVEMMSRAREMSAAEVTEVRDFSETLEEVSVTRMLLPNVASANGTSETEENELDSEEETDNQDANDEDTKDENIEEEETLIIADVNSYVNIRSIPGTEGEILGKLYDDSVGEKLGEEDGWYYIKSGRVTGYVKAEYVLTGEAARKKADEVGERLAEVTTTTLKVRKEATTDSIVLGLVPEGDILSVLEETEGWVQVSVEEGDGYVSTDYVRLYTKNVEAESREEEEARLRKEEEERKAAEEAARRALENQKKQNNSSGSSNKTSNSSSGNSNSGNSGSNSSSGSSSGGNSNGSGSSSGSNSSSNSGTGSSGGSNSSNNSSTGSSGGSNSGSNSTTGNSSGSNSSSNSNSGNSSGGSSNNSSSSNSQTSSDLGQQIANYALKFLGNPYVYGGTSLTNGADCSGFVQSVYKNFGISLPRTSGEQGASGSAVDGVKNAKPGDLVWYSGHIGIYIGNEQIVHASNSKVGIITSNVYYRKILGIRRIV